MQPPKGQGGSDRGYGPEYGVTMPCLRLFRGRQDKDRHDEAIRDAEIAFRFPSLGPRSAGGRGGDHRNDRRSQVALSSGMVVRYEGYAENFVRMLYLGCCLILLRHL